MLDFKYREYLTIGAQAHLTNPDRINTIESVKLNDRNAAYSLARLEEALADLKEYRRMLAERAAVLADAVFDWRLTFIRSRRCLDAPISYDVTIEKVFADPSIKPEPVETYHFTGKERAAAKKKFEALRKSRPGIDTLVNIDKKTWER